MRPAYQGTTGERYWQASKRRAEIAAWWQESQSSGRPILLVVGDDVFDTSVAENEFVWPLPAAESLTNLSSFSTQLLSVDELAALLHDAGLAPIICRGEKRPPRYLVYDAAGKRTELPNGTSVSRLAQAMHAALESGAVAATAGAKGE